VGKIVSRTFAAWATRAFTPVFDGLWRTRDFAHAGELSSAPLPTPRFFAYPLIPAVSTIGNHFSTSAL
jgi:hypothetical protein